jgi:hypothetical protein
MDLGDAPTWLGAIFAGCAFVAAFLLFRIEQKRDDRQEQGDVEQQARLVTAWIRRKPGDEDALNLHLQNASNACIYNVVIQFIVSGRSVGFMLRDIVPPSRKDESI